MDSNIQWRVFTSGMASLYVKLRENYAKITRKLREKTIDIKNMLNLDHLEITVEGYHGNVSLVVYPKSMSKKMCIFAILK